MANFDVVAHNREAIRALLRAASIVPKTVVEATQLAALRAKARIVNYPPELPNQRYVRTGIFGDSWEVSRVPRGWKIEGDARQFGRGYTVFVTGDAFGLGQASIHQGRWERARKAVAEEVRELPVKLEPDVQAALRAAGF